MEAINYLTESAQPVNSLKHVPAPIQAVLEQIKRELIDFYGDRMQRLILFGSYARGDFHAESDIDLMPVLAYENGSAQAEKDYLFNLTYRYFERNYTRISITPVTAENFEKSATFLFMFVHREGIDL